MPDVGVPVSSQGVDDALAAAVVMDNGAHPDYDFVSFFAIATQGSATLSDCYTRTDSLLDATIVPGLQTFYLHSLQSAGFYWGFVQACLKRSYDGNRSFVVLSVSYISQDLAGFAVVQNLGFVEPATSYSFRRTLRTTINLDPGKQELWDRLTAVTICVGPSHAGLLAASAATCHLWADFPAQAQQVAGVNLGAIAVMPNTPLILGDFAVTVYFDWGSVRRIANHTPHLRLEFSTYPALIILP